jgi:hypothetical protein
MADVLSDRVAMRGVAAGLLVLALLGGTACSTGSMPPAASPDVRKAEEGNCLRSGGLWRNGLCDVAGSGGGGGY